MFETHLVEITAADSGVARARALPEQFAINLCWPPWALGSALRAGLSFGKTNQDYAKELTRFWQVARRGSNSHKVFQTFFVLLHMQHALSKGKRPL